MSANWFVAIKGKRQGPLTAEQLKQMAGAGQLQPTDMVMQEGGSKWSPANAVRGLFPGEGGGAAPVPAAYTAQPWFYAQNKQRKGPVSFDELRGLVRNGELQPADMVMQVGAAGWTAANQVQGLCGGDASTAIGTNNAAANGGIVAAGTAGAPDGTMGKLGGAAKSLFGGAKDFAVAASNEAARRAKLVSLRKDIDRLQDELEKKLPREVGSQLLNNGVRIPGCEQNLKSFLKLNRDFNMANQGALTGDKDKKREAAKIAGDLEPIILSYGRGALDANTPFEGRDQAMARRNKLEQEIGQKKAQLATLEKEWKGTSSGKKRGVLVAFGLVAAVLLIGAGVTLWMVSGMLFGGGGGSADAGATATGSTTGSSTARPDLKGKSLAELFAILSPSVPQVEAVGHGHGSGFLVENQGKLYVITNRHVVEDASSGISVHFIKSQSGGSGSEEKFTVPASQTSVVAIHKNADVAVVDVTKAAADIRTKWKIEPVAIAPKDHAPAVGAHVFAIGHPGDGGGGNVLTRTLSDGIVSATGRALESARYTQITVPINPGNSGGPLFDDQGRVVGVNTFGYRGGRSALSGLNFALEVAFVYEVMNDKSKSMSPSEMQATLGTLKIDGKDNPLASLAENMNKTWTGRGYRHYGGGVEKSQRLIKLQSGANRIVPFTFSRSRNYVAAVVSQGAEDIDLLVITQGGNVIAYDNDFDSTPFVTFQPRFDGTFGVVVSNPSKQEALIQLAIFER